MKKIFAFLLLFCIFAASFGCGKAGDPVHLEIPDTKKIILRNGSTGAFTEITDPEAVSMITDSFRTLTLKKEGKTDSTGWTYGISWLDENEKELLKLYCGAEPESVSMDGYDWTITGGSVDVALLDRLLG